MLLASYSRNGNAAIRPSSAPRWWWGVSLVLWNAGCSGSSGDGAPQRHYATWSSTPSVSLQQDLCHRNLREVGSWWQHLLPYPPHIWNMHEVITLTDGPGTDNLELEQVSQFGWILPSLSLWPTIIWLRKGHSIHQRKTCWQRSTVSRMVWRFFTKTGVQEKRPFHNSWSWPKYYYKQASLNCNTINCYCTMFVGSYSYLLSKFLVHIIVHFTFHTLKCDTSY